MKNPAKSPTSTPGARQPPATYYGDSHWNFLEIFEKKNRAKKNVFFEHETKTKKFVRSFLSIGSSRYVAQFLDHLEHSGYAIVSGEKNRPKFSVTRPNFTMGIPIVSCRGLPGSGSRFDDFP